MLAGLLGSVDLTEAADLPVRLGLSADAVTLGGEVVRDVRVDLAGGRAAWTVEHFEARLPGRASLRVAGDADAVAGFQGVVALEAPDPGQLTRWLDRTGAAPAERPAPLTAEAKVDLRPGRFVLDDLKLASAGLQMAGRLSWLYGGGRGALAADLTGATLDLDALQSLARTAGVTAAAAFAGDVRLNLGFDALRYGGITARRVEARLGWDADALRIDHLKLADYGGITAETQGALTVRRDGVEGGLRLALGLDGTAGLGALAGVAALPPALVRRLGEAAVPARLTAELAPADGGRAIKAEAHGKTAAGPVELAATVPLDNPAAVTLHAGLTASGARLMPLVGLDGPAGDGRLSLDWHGPAGGFEARLALPTLAAEARGRLDLKDGRLDPDLAVTLARADLAELMPALGHGPLPVSAVFTLARRGEALRAEAIDGAVGGVAVGGALDIAAGTPATLSGDIDAARLDGPALVAALVGRSSPAKGWSAEPFGKPALAALALDLRLATPHLALSEAVTVDDAKLALVHAAPRSELTLKAGTLAGGTAQGRLALTRAGDGVGADLRLALDGAELATLLPGTAPRPAGQLSLAIDAAGTGRAPADLVRALAGHGALTVERLSWPGLSAAAVGAVAGLATRARVPVEAEVRTAIATALAAAPLRLARVEAPLAVLGGQVRAGLARAETADASLRAGGSLDLAAMTLTGDLALAPRTAPLPGSPDIAVRWTGPAQAPERRLDVAGLVTGLTLAAAERAAKAADDAAIVGTVPAAAPPPVPAKGVPLPRPRPRLAAPEPAGPEPAAGPDISMPALESPAAAPSTAAPASKPASQPAARRPARRKQARALPSASP